MMRNDGETVKFEERHLLIPTQYPIRESFLESTMQGFQLTTYNVKTK